MSELQTSAIPLARIVESPLNHRKYFEAGALAELAESIKAHGVLQPVLVRPLPGGSRGGKGNAYELVYGHRRFRAAKLAGVASIPATVRALDDRQVLEVALIENCRRQDVRPLEEADAYRELHEKHAVAVKEIADQVGKSQEYVYARMKLAGVKSAEVRKALDAGKLSASTALLIARIPIEKLQDEAAAEILEGNYDSGVDDAGEPLPMSFRDAQDLVQQKYMLDLRKAPFDVKDAALIPETLACASCPKRVGNCRELYPESEVKNPEICTDTTCFEQKKSAAVKQMKVEAKEKGFKHLGVSPGLFDSYDPNRLTYTAAQKYVRLESTCEADPKQRTYKELLGKDAPLTLVIDGKGNERKLVAKADLSEALKTAGVKVKTETDREDGYAKQREAQQFRMRVGELALDKVIAEIESGKADKMNLLRMLAEDALLATVAPSTAKEIVSKASEEKLLGILVRGRYGHEVERSWNGYSDHLDELCRSFELSLKDVEKELKAADKEKEKPPAAPPEEPAPEKKPKKKGKAA